MSEPVNHLRDARLHQALSHAPDAQTLPSAVTRNTIKTIATNAIETSAAGHVTFQLPWWKKLWQSAWKSSGRTRSPWNAAFATLLLTSLISLLWYQKEAPDAALDERPVVAKKAPGAKRAGPVAPAPEAASATPAAPVAAAETQQLPALVRKSASATPPVTVAPKLAKAPPDASPEPKPANAVKSEAAGVATGMASGSQTGTVAAPVLAAAPEAAPPVKLSAAPALAPAPAPVPAPAPAPATAPAPAGPPAAVAPMIAARNRAAPLADRAMAESTPSTTALSRDWTRVDVTYLGRNERIAQPEAQALVDKVLGVLAANPPSRADGADGVPMMSLQLLDAKGTLAQFDLWNSAYKWRRMGQADVLGTLSPEAVAALLTELTRTLPK